MVVAKAGIDPHMGIFQPEIFRQSEMVADLLSRWQSTSA